MSTARGWGTGHAVVGLIIAVLLALAFVPSCFAPLVKWDDDANLEDNPHFRGWDRDRLTWMATASHHGHFQPLTWLSYAVDYSLWGTQANGELVPIGFHLTNVILHTLNGVLAFSLAIRVVSTQATSGNAPGNCRQDEPFPALFRVTLAIAVVCWGVHPLRVESVTWATERRQLLAAFFLLLSAQCWWTYLCGVRSRHGRNERLPGATAPTDAPAGTLQIAALYIGTCLTYALSLLSSAWGISFPALLLLVDVWPLNRWADRSETRGVARHAGGLLAEKLPFFAMSLLAMWMAIRSQASSTALLEANAVSFLMRLALAVHALGWYLAATVWPHPLVALRPAPPDWGFSYPEVWLYGSCFAAVLAGSVVLLRRGQPAAFVAILAYAIMLSPVSGIAQSGPQLVADRYSYLTTLPLFLVAGAAGARFAMSRSLAWASPSGISRLVLLAVPCVTVLMAGCWWTQSAWMSSLALWSKTVRYFPDHNPVAHHNLGVLLMQSGRLDEALQAFGHALRQAPDRADTLANAGNVYVAKGEPRQALRLYDQSLGLKVDEAYVWANRGVACQQLGDGLGAFQSYTAALGLNPADLNTRRRRAHLLLQVGRQSEAEADYRDYLRQGGTPDSTLDPLLRSGMKTR